MADEQDEPRLFCRKPKGLEAPPRPPGGRTRRGGVTEARRPMADEQDEPRPCLCVSSLNGSHYFLHTLQSRGSKRTKVRWTFVSARSRPLGRQDEPRPRKLSNRRGSKRIDEPEGNIAE